MKPYSIFGNLKKFGAWVTSPEPMSRTREVWLCPGCGKPNTPVNFEEPNLHREDCCSDACYAIVTLQEME